MRRTRCHGGTSEKYPTSAATLSNAINDRIPLHASFTSSVIAGSVRMFPSRSTGTSAARSNSSPIRDATNCSDTVARSKTIAGSGIMNTRNASGKARTRRYCDPKTYSTVPAITPSSEMRVRKSSAPSEPST